MTSATLAGMATMGERLRETRLARGWTANDLDKAAGVGGGQTSRYERGERAATGKGYTTTIERFARALGVRVEWLLTGAGPREARDALPEERRRQLAAAELAREDGVSEEAIASVLAAPVAVEDRERSTMWWAIRMRRAELDRIDRENEEPPTRATKGHAKAG